MGQETLIQWADHTFNPWRGCTKVAPECAHCYADKQAKRNPQTLGVWGDQGTRVVASESMWRQPVKWNETAQQIAECPTCGECQESDHWIESQDDHDPPRWDYVCKHCPATAAMCLHCSYGCEACDDRGLIPLNTHRPRVFCASMADVFEDWHGTILNHSGTIQQVRLRLFDLIDATPWLDWLLLTKRPQNVVRMWPDIDEDFQPKYRPNVWLITSAGSVASAETMIPDLLTLRPYVPVLGVSAEPLLEPVDLAAVKFNGMPLRSLAGKLDWVIAGGESGPHARPCDPAWIASLIADCSWQKVPCFVKQLGAKPVGLSLSHPKGGDLAEWPEHLRVREFPTVQHAEADA